VLSEKRRAGRGGENRDVVEKNVEHVKFRRSRNISQKSMVLILKREMAPK